MKYFIRVVLLVAALALASPTLADTAWNTAPDGSGLSANKIQPGSIMYADFAATGNSVVLNTSATAVTYVSNPDAGLTATAQECNSSSDCTDPRTELTLTAEPQAFKGSHLRVNVTVNSGDGIVKVRGAQAGAGGGGAGPYMATSVAEFCTLVNAGHSVSLAPGYYAFTGPACALDPGQFTILDGSGSFIDRTDALDAPIFTLFPDAEIIVQFNNFALRAAGSRTVMEYNQGTGRTYFNDDYFNGAYDDCEFALDHARNQMTCINVLTGAAGASCNDATTGQASCGANEYCSPDDVFGLGSVYLKNVDFDGGGFRGYGGRRVDIQGSTSQALFSGLTTCPHNKILYDLRATGSVRASDIKTYGTTGTVPSYMIFSGIDVDLRDIYLRNPGSQIQLGCKSPGVNCGLDVGMGTNFNIDIEIMPSDTPSLVIGGVGSLAGRIATRKLPWGTNNLLFDQLAPGGMGDNAFKMISMDLRMELLRGLPKTMTFRETSIGTAAFRAATTGACGSNSAACDWNISVNDKTNFRWASDFMGTSYAFTYADNNNKSQYMPEYTCAGSPCVVGGADDIVGWWFYTGEQPTRLESAGCRCVPSVAGAGCDIDVEINVDDGSPANVVVFTGANSCTEAGIDVRPATAGEINEAVKISFADGLNADLTVINSGAVDGYQVWATFASDF